LGKRITGNTKEALTLILQVGEDISDELYVVDYLGAVYKFVSK